MNIHHWQQHNPIITEALVQLTLGAPQPIYNGGLLHCSLRYFDPERRRPGLPADVAALVEQVEATHVHVRLINLNPTAMRTVLVQAGGFGEHRFESVAYDVCVSEYPGSHHSYAPLPIQTIRESTAVGEKAIQVLLPPATSITLDLGLSRYVNEASYALPW